MAGLKEAFLVEVRAGAPVAHRLLLQVRKRQVATARRRRPDRIRQLVLGDAYAVMIVEILKGRPTPRKVLTFYEAVELRKLAVRAIEAQGDAVKVASTGGDWKAASAASAEACRHLLQWIEAHTDYTTPATDVD